MKKAAEYRVVGKAEARSDGAEKVTGKALYTVDVELPGMAHGKILRSPYAHARLARVDASAAEKLPGVFAVITRDDQRRLGMFGAAYKDQTIVAVDKVRYAGDPVAAVAAVDEATAEQALSLIEVDYEDLPRRDQSRRSAGARRPAGARSGGQRRRADGSALRGAEGIQRHQSLLPLQLRQRRRRRWLQESRSCFRRHVHVSAGAAFLDGTARHRGRRRRRSHHALGRHPGAVHFARASRRDLPHCRSTRCASSCPTSAAATAASWR